MLHRPGIGTEDFDKLAALTELGESRIDLWFGNMSEKVKKKNVFPGLLLEWPGFNLGEVDSPFGKRLQHAAENPRFILHGKEHRSFVVSGEIARLAGNNQKTGKIVHLVLNAAADHFEVVE